MSKEDKAYIVQLVKQIFHPYFAGEIADILIAHGMTFKTEPQTNADHIRAMSDEELARFLEVFPKQLLERFGFIVKFEPDYVTVMLEWLQQPVKEDS